MFKPRWTVRIKTPTQAIIIPCETEQLARLMASKWFREGYEEVSVRKHARQLSEGSFYFLLAILFASPWLIVAGLGL